MSRQADHVKDFHHGCAGDSCLDSNVIMLAPFPTILACSTSFGGMAPFTVSGGRTPGKYPVRGAMCAAGRAWWIEAGSLDTSPLTLA